MKRCIQKYKMLAHCHDYNAKYSKFGFFNQTQNLDVIKVTMSFPTPAALPQAFLPNSGKDILHLKHPKF